MLLVGGRVVVAELRMSSGFRVTFSGVTVVSYTLKAANRVLGTLSVFVVKVGNLVRRAAAIQRGAN
jgi:hypothetical protein